MRRATTSLRPRAVAETVFWALLAALALIPVFVAQIPAMADYPNHLARMHLLARDAAGDAHPFYQTAWRADPNLAMDILIPFAAKALGVETAMRAFLLLSQLLILSGSIAIEQVVKGRISVSPFVGGIFLYSLPFAWGFLNFEFGIGLALWGFAAMVMVRDSPWPTRLVIHTMFCAFLFAAHFYAFGVYGAALGFYELWRITTSRLSPEIVLCRLVLLATPAVILVVLMAFAGGAVGGEGMRWYFSAKPLWLFLVLNGYNFTISALSGGVLLCFIVAACRRGVLRLVGAGPWLAGGFAALFLLIPGRLFDTSFADVRIIPAVALILPAFMSFSFPNRIWRYAAVSISSVIAIVNLALVLFVWTSYNEEYKTLVESFGRLDKGARVLVAHSGQALDPPILDLGQYPIYNAPTLAVHYADAFVPSLFTAKGKQPLSVHERVRALDIPYGAPAPNALLKSVAEGEGRELAPIYIRNWPQDYDYLYVVGPLTANPMPALLEQLCHGSRFVLYRIRK